MATPKTGNDIALGTFYMIFAALLLALGATSARFAASGLTTKCRAVFAGRLIHLKYRASPSAYL